ncbi:calcium-translocating P-type ATPase, PMCA-type [Anaerofustis sp.]|uniref:calcium-translocating P-type ATPase, PMCA-type n=1 Tax=Anaerofustis sp. TaxID=1872517 RepID=UPI0025C7385E|nr:calcium-translocating P-type ATPase, PMCA-type [Anaerofustis sp.]
MKNYYNQSANDVKTAINGSTEPISSSKVKENQEKYGYNELSEGKKKSILQIFLEQYKDFLVIILIISAVISMFLGEKESAIVILVVITINAILGTVQTIKAEQSLNSLKQLSSPNAKVLRNGIIVEIPSREVTIGDEVHLEAGDYIPSDGRIIECSSLKVDESALTGESLAVEKTEESLKGELPLGDRKNMVYSGSFVTYGRASYIVTDIGMNTEVGKIASLIKNTSEKKTPLQVNLDKFGQKLSIAILALCGLLFALQVIQGGNITDAFLFAVALAVAAIPEALSSIVTIVLAFGTQKMAKEGAIIRKLQAVEGLGSVSVICSDKTGTLTQNKMTVENYYVEEKDITADKIDINNPSHADMLLYSILCNDSTNVDGNEIGDPTETALINLGEKYAYSAVQLRKKYPRLSEIPFDSDRKLMSTLNKIKDNYTVITKGAIDVILNRVTHINKDGKNVKITKEDIEKIEKQNLEYSKNGLRVLGVAYKTLKEEKTLDLNDEYDLIFLGLISMMDPPREESAKAVQECLSAGIKPVMITGDHKVTASAIAKRIGILRNDDEACEGAEIENMSDEELKSFVEKTSVYARVSPEHKIRIVRAWQDKGNIVAMTGDGVNDAPALKQADVGVAMGITGTEVSKDASSMVLTDDNFATIVKAVDNGRNVYANIKKAIQFLISGNFAAILVVLFASLTGLPVPFAPVHLLFINLLTDSLPAIALGLEPHNHDVMNEPPRPMNESIMNKKFLTSVGTEGFVISIMTIAAFLIGYKNGNAVLASTMAFATLCLSRLMHGYNCKENKPVLFTKRFFNNKYMQGAFAIGFVLLNTVLLIPAVQSIFSVQTLNITQLITVYILSFINIPVIQLLKKIRNK